MSDKTDEVVKTEQLEAGQSRRDFLKNAGKFAVYTPPTMMLLMKPGYASMSKSFCGRPGKQKMHHHNGGRGRRIGFRNKKHD